MGGLHIERVRNMSGMTAYLGIILGAAGIVFGVIALMVSAEMSRRVTALIDSRFEQSERLNAFSNALDDVRNVRRVIPTDEERGFTAKVKTKESFVSASPFAD